MSESIKLRSEGFFGCFHTSQNTIEPKVLVTSGTTT